MYPPINDEFVHHDDWVDDTLYDTYHTWGRDTIEDVDVIHSYIYDMYIVYDRMVSVQPSLGPREVDCNIAWLITLVSYMVKRRKHALCTLPSKDGDQINPAAGSIE